MSRRWKLAVAVTTVSLLFTTVILAQESKPAFTANDRELIEAYYSHLMGTLAPGSLDRSGFPLGIEKVLIPGSHVPMQLEKDLQPLPATLESTKLAYRRLWEIQTGPSCCTGEESRPSDWGHSQEHRRERKSKVVIRAKANGQASYDPGIVAL